MGLQNKNEGMTCHELIQVLKTYPPTSPVVAEWDGGWSKVEDHELQTDDSANPVVVLDVTDYGSYYFPK